MKKMFFFFVIAFVFVLTSCCDAYMVETIYEPDYYTVYPYTRVIISPAPPMHRHYGSYVRHRHYAAPPVARPPMNNKRPPRRGR